MSPHLAARQEEVDMKHRFSNRSIPLLVSLTLATVTLPVLQAEQHCPAGIASVTPRFVQRALIVIPVRINQKVV
jgi:hypothetical protein